MRRIILLLLPVCVFGTKLLAQAQTNNTEKTDTLPYQKYPTLPAFNVLEMDSSTIFNTFNIPMGSITALVLFDPDCKHCQHTVKNLTAGMDSLKNIKFYFVTPSHDFARLRKFYEEYHLADYKNIMKVGRDPEFFFISYYHTRSFPVVVLYDEHKKLMKLKEGSFTVNELYNMAR